MILGPLPGAEAGTAGAQPLRGVADVQERLQARVMEPRRRNATGMWSPMSLEPAVIEHAARRGTAALNKAFTKDNDSADDNDGAPAVPPLPAGAKNYLTPQGYARLRAELLNLLDSERPKVVEVVSWAAKNGDRSENGDYLYGKKRLREIDRRIRFLTLRLDIAEVADPSLHFGQDQVFFGATVTYVDEAGAERTITIKGIDEVEHLGGEVSWISPVARALLKARVGDEVLLATPNGPTRIEVVAVRYPAPPGD